jgi:hypothetical protein
VVDIALGLRGWVLKKTHFIYRILDFQFSFLNKIKFMVLHNVIFDVPDWN